MKTTSQTTVARSVTMFNCPHGLERDLGVSRYKNQYPWRGNPKQWYV